jgi:hypothetical protein
MNVDQYLQALEAKIRALGNLVTSSSLQREVDVSLGIGFIKGRIAFVDGSALDFTEQLPVARGKFRFHYMDAASQLVRRWDSAPHYPGLNTFPFHVHAPDSVESHPAISLLDVLDEIVPLLKDIT